MIVDNMFDKFTTVYGVRTIYCIYFAWCIALGPDIIYLSFDLMYIACLRLFHSNMIVRRQSVGQVTIVYV